MIVNSTNFSYNKATKTFTVDGRNVRFDSNYKLVNLKKGTMMEFESLSSSADRQSIVRRSLSTPLNACS